MALRGKNAVITGSTSGIGLGIAEAFAKEGMNLVINGFGDAGEIEKIRAGLASKFGVKVTYDGADMSKPDQIEAMMKKAASTFGGVDILFANEDEAKSLYQTDDFDTALQRAAVAMGPSLTLAAVATSACFFSFVPTDYSGLAELGFIAGSGMIVAYLLCATMLPALLRLMNPQGEVAEVGRQDGTPRALPRVLGRRTQPFAVAQLVADSLEEDDERVRGHADCDDRAPCADVARTELARRRIRFYSAERSRRSPRGRRPGWSDQPSRWDRTAGFWQDVASVCLDC